jgi:hypothetical protein
MGLEMYDIILDTGVKLLLIPSAPNDDYRAGSDGQIYSRTRFSGFGKKEYTNWYPLKGCKQKKGYISITMCDKGKKRTRNAHRLICEAFHGEPNPRSLQCRHLDGNPEHNTPDNLMWGTQEENWMDRKEHGHGMEGEKHFASKLSDKEREAIRWVVSKGICSRKHIAKMLDMSSSAISIICKGMKSGE